MLDALRTPDERFDGLPDFPFTPNYLDNLHGFEGQPNHKIEFQVGDAG